MGEAWPQFRYDAANTGHAPENSGPVGGLKQSWAFETESEVWSSPSVVDGTLYIANDNLTVYALDATTGKEQWSFEVPRHTDENRKTRNMRELSPVVVDDIAYFGNGSDTSSSIKSRIYALNATNGTERWQFETTGDVLSAPTVVNGVVYVTTWSNAVHALDAVDGTEQWTFNDDGDRPGMDTSPAVVDGTLYIGSSDYNVYALDAITGEQEWIFSTGHWVATSPAVVDGTIYIGSYDNHVYALDASDGTEQWSFEIGGKIRSSPAVVDGTLYIGSSDYNVYALDAITGEQQWVFNTGDKVASSPAVVDDTIFIGSLDGKVYAVSTSHKRPVAAKIPASLDLSVEYDKLTDKEPIGEGGNADVSKATFPTPEGDVILAIKKPRMDGTLHVDQVERMLDEAEKWDKLDDHDHIVGVVDWGSEPLPWIAMEYMDGGHLGGRIAEMNISQALWTAIAVTKGVRHAHRGGIAHLDLKPQNILFRTVEDAWDVPKVADWGLSKHLLDHSKSVEGMSVEYAAPEQVDEAYGPADDITDIYQLGAVFYELFTGRPPFEGQPFKVINMVKTDRPTPPSEIAEVPEALDEILLTALAKAKEDRYDDIIYLRDALQELFDKY